MHNKIVVGLAFGDEGKGLTTSFLSEKADPNSIVIRHNGGQQAGHTVEYNGRRHVFSQLGSGTLQGLPTYFTSDCTFYPPSFFREYLLLKDLSPVITIHPMTKITLPIDIDFNRAQEDTRGTKRHGSVGMGFGQTIARNEAHYTLYAKDLLYPIVAREKIKSIYKNYYLAPLSAESLEDIENFLKTVERVLSIIKVEDLDRIMSTNYSSVIYETSQGVLLDQFHGFFPNVTRSNTTSKNAIEHIKRGNGRYHSHNTEVYYITRTYQTRHGNGFMSNENSKPLTLKNNENETNQSHSYQGEFRTSPLDVELLKYAIQSDMQYSAITSKNLVITCLDQHHINITKLWRELEKVCKFDKIFRSTGPSLTNIKQIG